METDTCKLYKTRLFLYSCAHILIEKLLHSIAHVTSIFVPSHVTTLFLLFFISTMYFVFANLLFADIKVHTATVHAE